MQAMEVSSKFLKESIIRIYFEQFHRMRFFWKIYSFYILPDIKTLSISEDAHL